MKFHDIGAKLVRVRARLSIVGLRVLSVAAGLAYVKAYTGELTIEEVGTFFYLSTLSYALNALIFLPVDSYMQARIASFESVPGLAIRRLILVTLAIGLVGCGLVSAPFVWFGKLQLADLPWLYAVAALLYLCTSLRNLLNIRGNSVFVSFMLLLESGGRLVAFVAMALMLDRSARTLMISSAVALALELVVILWRCRTRLHFSTEPIQLDPPSKIAATAVSLAGGAVSNAVQLQTYRVVFPLAGFGTTSGVYGIVSNVGASAMAAFGSIYMQIQLPKLYQTRGRFIGSFVAWAVLLSLGVLVVAAVFSSFLIERLTQTQYIPYAFAIAFGVVIEACNLIIGGYGVYLTIHQRTAPLFYFHLLGAVVAVSGCLATLQWHPQSPMLIGVALAASQLLITPLIGIFVLRHQNGKN